MESIMEFYWVLGAVSTLTIIGILAYIYSNSGELDGLQQLNDGGIMENKPSADIEVNVGVSQERRQSDTVEFDISDSSEAVGVSMSAYVANEISEHIADVRSHAKQHPEEYRNTGLEISDDESRRVSASSPSSYGSDSGSSYGSDSDY